MTPKILFLTLTSCLLLLTFLLFPTPIHAAPSITSVSDNRSEYSNSQIPTYKKFEVTFQITNSVAGNFQLPYDPTPPSGIDPAYIKHKGISVDGMFLPPGETDWNKAHRQPAFYYQYFQDELKVYKGQNSEWQLPLNQFAWKVRFSPDQAGVWKFKLTAHDAGGTTQSGEFTFTVIASTNKGFLRISKTDPRYFEFSNGEPFMSHGVQWPLPLDEPILNNQSEFEKFRQNGIQFLRSWISGMYGTAWTTYQGTRNLYNGYLPRTGLSPLYHPDAGRVTLTQKIDYNSDGNTGWFDACMFQKWDDPESVKQNTNYKLQIKYRGTKMAGPRNSAYSNYGFVAKMSGGSSCFEPGTGTVLTNYGGNTPDSGGQIEGIWNSGSNNFLPRLYFAVENVIPEPGQSQPAQVYIDSISLREVLANNQLGPEILNVSSMDYHLHLSQAKGFALDKTLALAEEYGMFLKLVIMEKNDKMYLKLNNDGTFVTAGQPDNSAGFYGLGRTVNKTRWLQQAWWRYLQARWGYSTAIHSWEATNEGNPSLTTHYELTDELGKFMKCRVFGKSIGAGDSLNCDYRHPNYHSVTTSFWSQFPGSSFWKNTKYPNVDYADVHAYISTSFAPLEEKNKMVGDAAYYHLWHSRGTDDGGGGLIGWNIGKPIVRGEAGMDLPGNQSQTASGIDRDTQGVWYHNYIWSTLDHGGLYEMYWWRNHIWNATYDHRPHHKTYSLFMKNIPLNNGNYQDAQPTVSNTNLRVVGQKDTVNKRAHVWIQNKNHTWKNVVDGISIPTQSGTITLAGFTPNTAYTLQWWDTWAGTVTSTQSVNANSQGNLSLSVTNLAKDTAVKIGNYSTSPTTSPPTPTPPTYSLDSDTDVDIHDILILISRFTQNLMGDFNGNGKIDIFDFNTLLKNRL